MRASSHRLTPAVALIGLLALTGPAARAAGPIRAEDVLSLAQDRFDAAAAERVAAALRLAPSLDAPTTDVVPRPLIVAHSLLLDEEPVEVDTVIAALLIESDATLPQIARAVGPGAALAVRGLRQPGVLPGCRAGTSSEAGANLERLSAGLQRVAVYAHVDALRPGRRPDQALACIRDAREGFLPALSAQNPALARDLRQDVDHFAERYASELSGEELFEAYRRPDGTLDWARLPERHRRQFTLDLFLRELVAVVECGDRSRMEELFTGLASTDFFEHYGAFSLGGSGRIVNARYLSRYLQPQFVEALMRSNVNLVLGQHVSDLARGEIEAHAFTVSLSSLGLDAAAVRAGMSALGFARRVQALKTAQAASQRLIRLSRLERLQGWVYVLAETAVVVYFSEWKNQWQQERQAARRARGQLLDASHALFAGLADGRALTLDGLDPLLEAYQDAWAAYREFLLRPVYLAEERAGQALSSLAEEGKRLDDKRRAMVARLRRFPGLLGLISQDHGSLDAFAAGSIRADERELERKLEGRVSDLLEERETRLREVYGARRRKADYLDGVSDLGWHVRYGAREGAPGDPHAGGTGLIARADRERARRSFASALERLSDNRLQTYEDEERVLRAVAASLADRPDLQGLVGGALSETQRAAQLDRDLASPR